MGVKGSSEVGAAGALAAVAYVIQDVLWSSNICEAYLPFTLLRLRQISNTT